MAAPILSRLFVTDDTAKNNACTAKKNVKQKQGAVAAASPYKDKIFLSFLALQLLFAICFFQLFTTVPLFFKEGLRMNEFSIGVVMGMNGLLIALVEMVIVFKLEGRTHYLILMSYGAILMAIAFLLLNLPLLNGLVIAAVFMLSSPLQK